MPSSAKENGSLPEAAASAALPVPAGEGAAPPVSPAAVAARDGGSAPGAMRPARLAARRSAASRCSRRRRAKSSSTAAGREGAPDGLRAPLAGETAGFLAAAAAGACRGAVFCPLATVASPVSERRKSGGGGGGGTAPLPATPRGGMPAGGVMRRGGGDAGGLPAVFADLAATLPVAAGFPAGLAGAAGFLAAVASPAPFALASFASDPPAAGLRGARGAGRTMGRAGLPGAVLRMSIRPEAAAGLAGASFPLSLARASSLPGCSLAGVKSSDMRGSSRPETPSFFCQLGAFPEVPPLPFS